MVKRTGTWSGRAASPKTPLCAHWPSTAGSASTLTVSSTILPGWPRQNLRTVYLTGEAPAKIGEAVARGDLQSRELLDHAQAEDGRVRGVMQDVEADQPRVEVAVIRESIMIGLRFRHSITNRDSIGGKGGTCQHTLAHAR